jgi:hypothetical protein
VQLGFNYCKNLILKFFTTYYTKNVKAYIKKCGNFKKENEGKQNTKIYPVVSVGTRPSLVHVVEALRVLLFSHRVSSGTLLDSPLRISPSP